MVITSSCGALGETCRPLKCRFVMFMHGPVAHFSALAGDIAFLYVTLIDSPGAARITGACSLPLNANATRPLSGSLTASRVTGERASGGSAMIWASPGSVNSKMDATLKNRASLVAGVIQFPALDPD